LLGAGPASPGLGIDANSGGTPARGVTTGESLPGVFGANGLGVDAPGTVLVWGEHAAVATSGCPALADDAVLPPEILRSTAVRCAATPMIPRGVVGIAVTAAMP